MGFLSLWTSALLIAATYVHPEAITDRQIYTRHLYEIEGVLWLILASVNREPQP